MEIKHLLLILLGIGMLVGATQIGINMGIEYATTNNLSPVVGAASDVREIAPAYYMETKLTYQKIVEWLAKDKTNSTPYNDDSFTCVDYSGQVKANAEADNVRCGFMYIWRDDGTAHVIVVFDSVDRGLVYVEPQFDWVIPEPKAGLVFGALVKSVEKNYNSTYDYVNQSKIARVRIIW